MGCVIVKACRCGRPNVPGHSCASSPRPRVYDSPAYRRARKQLLAQATQCWICGEPGTEDDPLTADHVDPVLVAGGTGELRAAHRSCNGRRGQALQQGRPE